MSWETLLTPCICLNADAERALGMQTNIDTCRCLDTPMQELSGVCIGDQLLLALRAVNTEPEQCYPEPAETRPRHHSDAIAPGSRRAGAGC